jgi:hypothetical protein
MPVAKSKLQLGRWPLAALLLMLSALPATAGTPRDNLLRLVPEDVGFCLVIQDLRGHSQAFFQSPFANKLWESPIGKAIAGAPEQQKLREFETQLQQGLGVSWQQLRDEIFGDAVIFAYRPGSPGKEDQEQGLMLVQVRDAQLLADLAKRFNEIQRQAGDLKEMSDLEHNGVKYQRRLERHGENFAYLHGSLLAFSTREAMLQQVIDLERKSSAEEPAILRHLRRLDADQALAALWINPRAFDASFEQKAKQLQGTEATILQTIQAHWKAVDGIALTATMKESEVKLTLALSAKTDLLPGSAKAVFGGEARPTDLWRAFPDNALLAMGGRLDTAAWNDFLSGFLPEDKRQALRDLANRFAGPALGKNVAKEVLPSLGPDWGLCVLAPSAEAENKGWMPHAVLALRIQQPDIGHAVLQTLKSLALLGMFAYNGSHPDQITFHSMEKMEGSYLDNKEQFPPGFQPAFALNDGYLVLASSPEAMRRFDFKKATAATGAKEIPLFRLSFHELAQYLHAHQSALAEHIAKKSQEPSVSKEEVSRKLSDLIQICQLFKRMELVQRSDAGTLTLALRLQTAYSLGK